MEPNVLKTIAAAVKVWIDRKVAEINHVEVIKDIYREVEISAGYFFILTIANLIALSGLITNSPPVIIGAMLISPLMGPILSFGFAFITGEEMVWKKSFKKIAISVVLSIIIAAIASFFSPLKDITNEIVARTRPNLYDLVIAFLAGTAGAVAICTKKNYLTIVPGVAIATAVIPPLSVTGFGIGVGSFNILLGGFFLFFTNFVAIIISTCAVFYFYGFRPSMITEADVAQLKKRAGILALVLFVISIPLLYTLQKSITEVRLRSDIQNTLKMVLDEERKSKLSNFSYSVNKKGELEISAVVNTVNYLTEADINVIEREINASLHRKATLLLDQVKVQPGGLKADLVKSLVPAIAPPKPPSEIIRSSRDSVITVVRKSSEKIDRIISPSKIADFYVGFHDKIVKVSINMKIIKDTPLSDEEIGWLRRIFADDLNLPVDLSVETVPFVPLLVFEKRETAVSDEMKKALLEIKQAYAKNSSITIMVEAVPESSVSYNSRIKLAQKRADAVAAVLTGEYGMPEASISRTVNKKKALRSPTVRVTVQ